MVAASAASVPYYPAGLILLLSCACDYCRRYFSPCPGITVQAAAFANKPSPLSGGTTTAKDKVSVAVFHLSTHPSTERTEG
jgi:hypothetical protein